MDLSNTLNNDIKRADNELNIIKDEVLTYLDNHPDLKTTIDELNIDEDFYMNELGGTGNGGINIKR